MRSKSRNYTHGLVFEATKALENFDTDRCPGSNIASLRLWVKRDVVCQNIHSQSERQWDQNEPSAMREEKYLRCKDLNHLGSFLNVLWLNIVVHPQQNID